MNTPRRQENKEWRTCFLAIAANSVYILPIVPYGNSFPPPRSIASSCAAIMCRLNEPLPGLSKLHSTLGKDASILLYYTSQLPCINCDAQLRACKCCFPPNRLPEAICAHNVPARGQDERRKHGVRARDLRERTAVGAGPKRRDRRRIPMGVFSKTLLDASRSAYSGRYARKCSHVVAQGVRRTCD